MPHRNLKTLLLLNISLYSSIASHAHPMDLDEAWQLQQSSTTKLSLITYDQPRLIVTTSNANANKHYKFSFGANGWITGLEELPATYYEEFSSGETQSSCWHINFQPPAQWPVDASLICNSALTETYAIYRDQEAGSIVVAHRNLRKQRPSILLTIPGQNFYSLPKPSHYHSRNHKGGFAIYNATHPTLAKTGHHFIYIDVTEGVRQHNAVNFSMSPKPAFISDGLIAYFPPDFMTDLTPTSRVLLGLEVGKTQLWNKAIKLTSIPSFLNIVDDICYVGLQTLIDIGIEVPVGFIKARNSTYFRDDFYFMDVNRPFDLFHPDNVMPHLKNAQYLGHFRAPDNCEYRMMDGTLVENIAHHYLFSLEHNNGKNPSTYSLRSYIKLVPLRFEEPFTADASHHNPTCKDVQSFCTGISEDNMTLVEWAQNYHQRQQRSLPGTQKTRYFTQDIPLFPFEAMLNPARQFVAPQSFRVLNTEDNNYPIPVHYWPTENAKAMVLVIHGGPHVYEDAEFAVYIQYLASHGYSIARPEPRGSDGYGSEHLNAHVDHWDDVDTSDIMAVAQYFKNNVLVPEFPMFIAGASYGGFATLATITHPPYHTFFKGAVPIAGIYDWNLEKTIHSARAQTAHNATEMAYRNHQHWKHLAHWNGRIGTSKVDIPSQMHNLETPTLLIHGDKDDNCEVSQAQAVHDKAVALGKPFISVISPTGGHSLMADPLSFKLLFNLTIEFFNSIIEGTYKAPQGQVMINGTDFENTAQLFYSAFKRSDKASLFNFTKPFVVTFTPSNLPAAILGNSSEIALEATPDKGSPEPDFASSDVPEEKPAVAGVIKEAPKEATETENTADNKREL